MRYAGANASYRALTDGDIVVRYDGAEAIVGLTVLHASQR